MNTDFFLSNPDTKAEFGSFLWNELNERASHFCAYQKRSGLPVARLPNTIRTRMMVSRSGIALRTGILLIVTRKKQRLNELVPLLLFTVRATKHGLIVIALLFIGL